MSYQALYRRYRPAKFDDFVGQEAVIRTLRSQVISGRTAHAYLFCGTRGTGKTSAAKVLARAVNCQNPERGEPCGVCPACRALAEENSLDILEIDAASNNGVDEIRDLRDRVKYPPQVGKYKVYIIDEVHMLSSGAFNALLKTLEEPPEYVMFILATTEPQKLPATILSRCQRFDFHRIPASQITAKLETALTDGSIPYETAALARIARAAEGGMRDAWSIMDMCLGYAQESGTGLTENLVLDVLGSADRGFLFRFAGALLDGNTADSLALIDRMLRDGKEVQTFARDVGAHLRALMLAQVCTPEQLSQILDTTAEDAGEYCEQAGKADPTRLMRMLDLFLAAETDMKWSTQPRFALEEAAVRACLPEEKLTVDALTERVALLEKKLKEGAFVPAAAAKGKAVRTAAPQEPAALEPVPEAPKGPDGQAQDIWRRAVDAVKKKNPSVFGQLRLGRLATAEDGMYTAVFEKNAGGIYVELLNSDAKKQIVESCLTEAAGYACRFHAALEGQTAESDEHILQAKREAEKKVEDNLNRVFDMFGRENVSVLEEPQK